MGVNIFIYFFKISLKKATLVTRKNGKPWICNMCYYRVIPM